MLMDIFQMRVLYQCFQLNLGMDHTVAKFFLQPLNLLRQSYKEFTNYFYQKPMQVCLAVPNLHLRH